MADKQDNYSVELLFNCVIGLKWTNLPLISKHKLRKKLRNKEINKESKKNGQQLRSTYYGTKQVCNR